MTYLFIVPGRPVPKVRMTRKSKWTPRARRCLDYQELVAWHAKEAEIPTFAGDVELTVRICRGGRGRGDLDNIVKTIQDGLQYAGVIKNDRQVIRYGAGTGFELGWKKEHVIVEIQEVRNGNAS